MIKKYRYLNTEAVVKMDEVVADRLNKLFRLIMEHEPEFTSHIQLVTFGILQEFSQVEMIAFEKICEAIANDPAACKLKDPKEMLYFTFNEI